MKARRLVGIITLSVFVFSTGYSAEKKKTPSTPPSQDSEVVDSQAPQTPHTSASNQYSDHFANIYVNPLGFVFGYANIAAEFKVLDRLTLGPSVGYSKYTSGSSSASVWQLGANLTFFLSEPALNSSWFFGPFVLYALGSNGTLSANGVSVGSDFGYWWFWESGLNLGFGLGIQHITVNFSELNLPSLSSLYLSMKLTLGIAF